MSKCLCLILCLCTCILNVHVFGYNYDWDSYFEYNAYIDPEEMFHVYWTPHQDECIVEYGIEVETQGWAGFGISASGGMSGSDIVIGWVDDETDEVYLQNRFALSRSLPMLFNDQSGIELIQGWRDDINGTVLLYLHFEKETFPDIDNSQSVSIGTTRVIYAWNDNNPATPNSQIPPHNDHNERGPESVNILQGETKTVTLEDDVQTFHVHPTDVIIPAVDTAYICSLLEIPHFEETQHVVRYDPFIQEENLGIVHHILAYECPERYVDAAAIGTYWDCNDHANMATNATKCASGTLFAGWAVGGKAFYFPKDVGMEIGGENGLRYILMETHYNNVIESPDYIDSSGLTFWYTPTLRKETAQTIVIGHQTSPSSLFIPSGFISTTYSQCYAECLTAGMGEDGVLHAFANLLHMHEAGHQQKLRHIRGNEELRVIDMNLNYDFDYQQVYTLPEEILINPGDELIVECVYDTTDKDYFTFGGQKTSEEMCLTFLFVYPKPKLAVCDSTFPLDDFFDWADGAFEKGYLYFINGSEFYDITVDGAVEYYNDFMLWDYREQSRCSDADGQPLIPNKIHDFGFEFEEYDQSQYYVCGDGQGSGNGNDSFEWNSWYVYTVASIVAVVVVAVMFFAIFKCQHNKNHQLSYHRAYGSTDNQISLQPSTT